MSFILDALRKSDAERQRGAAPGLADVRYATHRSQRNIWVPLLAVVLAVNIGFMAWLWYDKSTASAPADPMKLTAPVAGRCSGRGISACTGRPCTGAGGDGSRAGRRA